MRTTFSLLSALAALAVVAFQAASNGASVLAVHMEQQPASFETTYNEPQSFDFNTVDDAVLAESPGVVMANAESRAARPKPAPAPVVVKPKPPASPPRPAVTTVKPAVTTVKPAVTTVKPAVTTAPPAVTTAAPAKSQKVAKLFAMFKAIFDHSKQLNENYAKGSCWRKVAFAKTSAACAAGYSKNLGVCTANCPLETPVKCGPTCLPQGRSCANEVVKKTTVTGLFLAKVFGVGVPGIDQVCDVLRATTAKRDVVRMLQADGASCENYLAQMNTLTPSEFAELVQLMYPRKTGARALQQQPPPQKDAYPATECGQGIFDTVTALAEAYHAARKTSKSSAEALLADSAAASRVAQTILTCVNAAGAHQEKIAAGIEAIIAGFIAYFKEGKSVAAVAEEVGLRLVVGLDPYSVVAFAHEFIQGFCPSATLPTVKFSAKVSPMGPTPAALGLQGKGIFAASNVGSWDPTGASKEVSINVTNNMPFTVRLKLYTGGHRLRDKATGVKVTPIVVAQPGEISILKMPLSQLQDRTVYVDAMVDRKVWSTLATGAKDMANKAISIVTLGFKPETFTTGSAKLGSLVFWVPGASSTYTAATGALTVKAQMGAAKTTP